jgi:hypothetical protein
MKVISLIYFSVQPSLFLDEVFHPEEIEPSIEKISKIKKIIKNVDLHSGKVLVLLFLN